MGAFAGFNPFRPVLITGCVGVAALAAGALWPNDPNSLPNRVSAAALASLGFDEITSAHVVANVGSAVKKLAIVGGAGGVIFAAWVVNNFRLR